MAGDKPKIIHSEKLFGGRETAMDVHRRLAWNNHHCQVCSSPPVIRISCGMSPKDLVEKSPPFAAAIMSQSENGQIPSFMSKYGPMTWFSEVFACETHKGAAERAAAHLPSNVLVEIDRGPGLDKLVVQSPGMPASS